MPNLQSSSEFARSFAATLSRAERCVLTLRYVEQLSVGEIGAVMDLSPHQVDEIILDLHRRTRVALQTASA